MQNTLFEKKQKTLRSTSLCTCSFFCGCCRPPQHLSLSSPLSSCREALPSSYRYT
uniref:Predicted protein n=1 Tax=Hordeum vulgare subsp. vulgare TaxID=112509 RepID=F2DB83_HORVV|nr:predicted protein [Hordeum vulgare subsp. vulgare]